MKGLFEKTLICCCLFLFLGMGNTFSQMRWDSLHGGRFQWPNAVLVMYADSNYVYAAGAYNEIGGRHMQGIARWNGVQWDSMGLGIDGLAGYATGNSYPSNTWSIITYHSKLYVGGEFLSLGNINTPGLGTWDGIKWDSLPVQSHVGGYCMAVINNKLYMGGPFTTVAGFSCIGIACWNDTNWSSLNFPNFSFFNGIDAICEYSGSIYVGGYFGNAADSVSNIMRYDSVGWHSVPGKGIYGSPSAVSSMVVYNGELYVAGYFFQSNGNIGNDIQRWNGTSWSDVGGGMPSGEISNLIIYNGKLYALGGFNIAGGVPANNIAEWDGTKWCGLGDTFNNAMGTSCIYKDTLYVGGGFGTIDNDSISYIAKWIGGNYVDTCGNDATGISQLTKNTKQAQVYPNPSNREFNFDFNSPIIGAIEVYDITGEKIYQQAIQSDKIKIDLSGQPAGIYFYRAITNTGSLIGEGKVIIQR